MNRACVVALAVLLNAAFSTGCSGDLTKPTGGDPTKVFWALRIDKEAVTLSTGESQQLAASPQTVLGTAITGLPTPTWTSTDTTTVRVDANGTITALKPGFNVLVIATLQNTAENLTNADTTVVIVTPSASTIASFSIHPTDSTLLAAGEPKSLAARVKDSDGNDVTGLSIKYTSSDPGKLDVDPMTGDLNAKNIGDVKIVATTTSYGQTFSDSVTITVTYPINAYVDIYNPGDSLSPPYFANRSLTVRAGATVTWTQYTAVPVNVTFDNPSAVSGTPAGPGGDPPAGPGGNIPAFDWNDPPQSRVFKTPGTYTFTNTLNGDTGKIIVVQ